MDKEKRDILEATEGGNERAMDKAPSGQPEGELAAPETEKVITFRPKEDDTGPDGDEEEDALRLFVVMGEPVEDTSLLQKLKRAPWKKRLPYIGAAAVSVALLGLFLLGGGKLGGNSLTTELKAAAEERTSLVVGVNSKGTPPFIYMDYDGVYTGTDYEVMRAVCDYYGWELVITPIDWSNREAVLASGDVDCLWSGFNCYGREGSYSWSEPYLDISDVVVVPTKTKDIQTLEDLEDKTVVAIKESSAYQALSGVGIAMQRLGCDDLDQAVSLLTDGTADAVVLSKEEAETVSGRYKVLDDCLDYNTFAVACPLEDETLPALLNYAFTKCCD